MKAKRFIGDESLLYEERCWGLLGSAKFREAIGYWRSAYSRTARRQANKIRCASWSGMVSKKRTRTYAAKKMGKGRFACSWFGDLNGDTPLMFGPLVAATTVHLSRSGAG